MEVKDNVIFSRHNDRNIRTICMVSTPWPAFAWRPGGMKTLNAKQKFKDTPAGRIPVEWGVVKFGKIAEFSNGLNYLAKSKTYQINVLGVSGFKDKRVANLDCIDNIFVDRDLSEDQWLKQNDLVFVRSNGSKDLVGRCMLIPELGTKVAFSGFTIRARLSDGSEQAEFLSFYFGTNNIRTQFKTLGAGTNISNLSQKILKNVFVPQPPKEERSEITKILSTWDQAIRLQQGLIREKQERKRGLMQQLLTGKRRLAGFGGEWRKLKLSDVLRRVSRPVEFNDDEEYPLISIRRRSGGLFHRETLFGKDIKTKSLFAVEAGDFLISKMQIVHGASGLVDQAHSSMFVSGSYICCRMKERAKVTASFFDLISRMPIFYHECFRSSYGVHIEKMTFNYCLFLKTELFFPQTLKEQDAIAGVLKDADRELEKERNRLEELKTQKKGLMQKLLTGQVRCVEKGDAE
jgi:type I restriction enzyme S subunit